MLNVVRLDSRRKQWLAVALAAGVAAASLLIGLEIRADYYAGLVAYQNQDYAKALRELQPLARQGEPRAQFLLGRIYRDGRAVPQDFVQAHMWLNLAAIAGQTKASKERDALAGRMTAAQIVEAQQLAANWKPEAAAIATNDGEVPDADQASTDSADAQNPATYDSDSVAAIEPAAQAPVYDDRPLTRSQITDLQWQLAVHGYDPGPADGVVGPRTRAAIQNYQEDADLPIDGIPTLALLDHLQFTNPPVRNSAVASYDDGATSTPASQPRVLYQSNSSDGSSAASAYGTGSSSNYDYAPEAAARLTKIYTVTIQRELAAKGYQPGPADGVAGPRTSSAIRRYQADNGLMVDGSVSLGLLNHLRLITGAQTS